MTRDLPIRLDLTTSFSIELRPTLVMSVLPLDAIGRTAEPRDGREALFWWWWWWSFFWGGWGERVSDGQPGGGARRCLERAMRASG